MFARLTLATLQPETLDMPPFGRFENGCALIVSPSHADLSGLWRSAGRFPDLRGLGLGSDDVLVWDANKQIHELVVGWLKQGRPDLAVLLGKPPLFISILAAPEKSVGKDYPYKGPPGQVVGIRVWKGKSFSSKVPKRLLSILRPVVS